jgi:hypothetical protein
VQDRILLSLPFRIRLDFLSFLLSRKSDFTGNCLPLLYLHKSVIDLTAKLEVRKHASN